MALAPQLDAGPLARRGLATGSVVVVGLLVALVIANDAATLGTDFSKPTLWVMMALAALAGTQAFVDTPSSTATPVVICPTICFTFAILLCWGPAPAIMAQCLAVAVVATRLHRPFHKVVAAIGQYTLAFAAAELVLRVGKPDPMHHHRPLNIAADALSIVGAIAVWLLVWTLAGLLIAWLWRSTPKPRHAVGNQLLFTAALLLLSPILAIAEHVNIGYIALVFVPLYAVQRMAKLSAQRDRAARLDPLTGLANRTGLKAASAQLALSVPDLRTTLILADLDDFKHVNDALGHEIGDQLLMAVAQRLGELPLGPGATIARLGGDEFALVTVTRADDEARELAAAVVATLAKPVTIDGLRVDVTASVGIAVQTDRNEDFATLMRHADIAMYDAKQRGGGVTAYEPGSHQDSAARLALLTDFRQALESGDRDQIVMHYQPQVSLTTGRVEGVEALLRWFHPRLGPVSTQDLIVMAERSSVMHVLTMRVIDDVVAQVAAWAADGIRLRASINVSSRDLYGDDIVPHLAEQLATHDVDPRQIQLEITEGALLRDPSRAAATIARLCRLGVSIALDDFGTGYSSLQHLRKLPISEIKIDKSFVCGMANNHDDAAIVRSTLEMARSLGIRTVAEGVEDGYIRALLAEAGCTLAQGWLTAHPMPAPEIAPWLRRTPVEEPQPADRTRPATGGRTGPATAAGRASAADRADVPAGTTLTVEQEMDMTAALGVSDCRSIASTS